MRPKPRILILLILCPFALRCQTSDARAPIRFNGSAAFFSNSFNGVPGARASLLGWDSALAVRVWHNLRFKFDVSAARGKNSGASQDAMFFLGGFEDDRNLGRERLFAHALFGDVGITRYWGPKALPGSTASFAYLLGGGVDTPINRHFALRVEGDLQHTNLYVVLSPAAAVPYSYPGLPRYMGRFSTGLVWTPRLGSEVVRQHIGPKVPPASELVFLGMSSVGHYHILAGSWWSYLHVGGLEYDRHSWGRFLRARVDYSADILPVAILKQPAKADTWGNPRSKSFLVNPGLEISPVGARLLWRDGTRFQPYYIVKFGVIGFTHKSFSPYASYEDITFQQAVGTQFPLGGRWGFRAGVEDFHISNGFIVPNDPGIDEMMYGGGLVYHLHGKKSGL